MSALAIVCYVTAALGLLAVGPSAYVLAREARRRYVERRALSRAEAARALVREHERQRRTTSATAEELAARFDPVTIQRALEAALSDRGRDAELFERLGLTARYLRELREAGSFCVRAHAAEVLGRLGVPEACGPLLAALRDADEDLTVKRAAADALALIRDPRAVPHLVRDLRAFGATTSPHLADALVGFGAAAVPALMEVLADELVDARAWAAKILGLIGDPAAAPALLARLRDAQARVREAAAEALGRLGDARATTSLIDVALTDPAPRVRASAAGALGRLNQETAAEALVAMLSDDDAIARAHALDALVAIRPKDVDPLYRALWDPAPAVRRRAAVAIERIGVLEAWMNELAADDPARRARARADIALLARAGLVETLFSYLKHPKADVRAAVVELWGELGITRLCAAIFALAGDAEARVRARVAAAIGRAQPAGGAEVLAKLLADPAVEVASAAATALASAALGRGADPSVIPTLERMLADANAAVRASAIQALAHIGGPAPTALLTAALADPRAETRVAIARALGDGGESVAPEIAGLLEERLSDSDAHVRGAAAIALGRIGGRVAENALLGPLSVTREAKTVALVFLATPESLARATDDLAADASLRRAVVLMLERHGEAAWTMFLDRIRCGGRGAGADASAIAEAATLLRTSPDHDVRLGAIALLDRGSADTGVDALADALLGDPSADVRLAAAEALATRPASPVAKSALARAALDPSATVAATAARALGNLRDPAHAEPLFTRLASGPEALRSAVEEALAQIYRASPSALIVRMEAADEPEVVIALARILERMAAPSTFDAIRALLSSPHARVREAAVRALAAISHPAVASALAVALQDVRELVRLAAVRAFATAGRGASAFERRSALRRALEDPSAAVRAAAAQILGVATSDGRGHAREPVSGRRVVGRPRRSSRVVS